MATTVTDVGPAGGEAAPRGGARRAGPPPSLSAVGRTAVRVGGPALAVTYLSLLVLLPLAALFTNAFSQGWSQFWSAITQPEAVAALELTLVAAAIVAVVNSVAGLAIAFVLVRDDFRGKAFVTRSSICPLRSPPSSPASPCWRCTAPAARSTSTWPAPGSASVRRCSS